MAGYEDFEAAHQKALLTLVRIYHLRNLQDRPRGLPVGGVGGRPSNEPTAKEFKQWITRLRKAYHEFRALYPAARKALEDSPLKVSHPEPVSAMGQHEPLALDIIDRLAGNILGILGEIEVTQENLEWCCEVVARSIPNGRMADFEHLRALLQSERIAMNAVAKSNATAPHRRTGAIFDADKGILVVDGVPIALEAPEKYVLAVLVTKGVAKFKDLEGTCNRPDRTLKALLKKHEPLKGFITLPGGPGKGGYATTIKLKKRPSRTRQK